MGLDFQVSFFCQEAEKNSKSNYLSHIFNTVCPLINKGFVRYKLYPRMTDNLKKGILLKIEDTLETLQLRLFLNKETIVNEENLTPTLKEAIDFYQSISLQNQQAHLVIKECEDTIEKLVLLKKYFSDLSLDAAIHLYNNYEGSPMPAFQQRVFEKLGKRQSSQ